MIQEQMISKLLKTGDASIILLNNLTDEYFSDYKTEFNYIKSHLSKFSVIPDMETFLCKFPDFDIIDVNEPVNYLLEELMRDKNKRFLANNYTKVRELMLNNDVDGALALLKQASETSSSYVVLNATDLIHDTKRLDTYKDMIDNIDKYFITTGFKELDKLYGGWGVRDDVVSIVARNGVGKSWVLYKCAAGAAMQGKRVGIYSGEMSDDSVGYRIDSIIGHMSNGALVHGSGSVKNQYERFLKELPNTCPGNIFVLTTKDLGKQATVSVLRAFIEKYKLDALYVDQISLLDDERGAKDPVTKKNNISTDLKALQQMKQIPIINVCQQNREKTDSGEFETTQIAGSDKIGQDSSFIIFLEAKDDIMKMHVKKARQGKSGCVLAYKIDFNTGTWEYISDETNKELSEEDFTDSNGNTYDESDVF